MAPAVEFDAVVSLGRACRLAKQMRIYFGASTAYPFDWWITPLQGAIGFLRDWDLDALYRPSRLALTFEQRKRSWVKHRDYGLILAHEFATTPFAWRRRFGLWVLPGYRWRTATPRSRTRHVMDNLEALDRAGKRVLFVRELERRDGEPSADQLTALRDAVTERFPACEASFLLISPDGRAAPGWTSLKVDDPSAGWAGDQAVWGAALDTLGFVLAPPTEQEEARLWRKAQKRVKQRREAAA